MKFFVLNKHHSTKADERRGLKLKTFLTMALDGVIGLLYLLQNSPHEPYTEAD